MSCWASKEKQQVLATMAATRASGVTANVKEKVLCWGEMGLKTLGVGGGHDLAHAV